MRFPSFRISGLAALPFMALAVSHNGVAEELARAPGTTFRDCPECPEMVVIPPGTFRMGDLAGNGQPAERPVHEVTVEQPFAIGKYEVTFAEWDACVAAGGCSHRPDDANWGRGRRPVSGVSWHDAQEYVVWLSETTNASYRLPTEAEWEYAARAGTTTPYPWGDELGSGNAVCLSCESGFVQTKEVGEQPANAFGLHDMIGSLREWVADCWHASYEGAPADASAWQEDGCERRVVRGGSWYATARYLRSASRSPAGPTDREELTGFRVARDL